MKTLAFAKQMSIIDSMRLLMTFLFLGMAFQGCNDTKGPQVPPSIGNNNTQLTSSKPDQYSFKSLKIHPRENKFYAKMNVHHQRHFALPLNNPTYVSAQNDKHMREDDVIIGLEVDGYFRAYPWWIIKHFHIVNDSLVTNQKNKKFNYVTVIQCEVCSGASAFYSKVENNPYTFSTFYLCAINMKWGTFEMCDVETRSHWHPFLGKAVEGALEGSELKRIPILMTSWKKWKSSHPQTTVLLAGQELRHRKHSEKEDRPGRPSSFGGAPKPDLQKNELVLGLANHKRAYSLTKLEKSQNTFKDIQLGAIVVKLNEFSAHAFHAGPNDTLKNLEITSFDPIQLTDENGAKYNWNGSCFKNCSKRKSLHILEGYVTEWYEYNRIFPKANVVNNIQTEWKTYSSKELDLALKDGKNIIIRVVNKRCALCNIMERKTLEHFEARSKLASFVTFIVDGTNKVEKENLFKKFQLDPSKGQAYVFLNSKGKALDELFFYDFKPLEKFLARLESASRGTSLPKQFK